MKPVQLTESIVKQLVRTKQPVAMLITIDKDMAQWLLDQVDVEHQRNRKEPSIRKYLYDMNSGHWVQWIPDVGIDGKMRVIQGQHMLAAFIRSELESLAVTLKITFEPEADLAWDHGRKRSFGEDLKWHGHDYGGKIAPVAVVLFQYEKGYYAGTAYTAARSADQYPNASQILEAAKMHPGIERHCPKSPRIFTGRGIPIAAIWAASYILHQFDPDQAPTFFDSLFEGTAIPAKQPKHPIRVLRESLEEREGKKRLRNGECLGWVIKAWNAYSNRQLLNKPILRPKEPFPELIPLVEETARPARIH